MMEHNFVLKYTEGSLRTYSKRVDKAIHTNFCVAKRCGKLLMLYQLSVIDWVDIFIKIHTQIQGKVYLLTRGYEETVSFTSQFHCPLSN